MAHITSGVDQWGAYICIDGYDPSPGQRGWYKSMRSPVGLGRSNLVDAEDWRRRTVREIRHLMRKLNLPDGTNFHQIIRAHQGLPLTCEPERGPSREAEDCRLIAEFEWEARQNWVACPASLDELLERHFRNSRELTS
jgi:hypothetical protein